MMSTVTINKQISSRFRSFLPVVIDVETTGFDPKNNAVIQIALVILRMEENGNLSIKSSETKDISPFAEAIIDKSALEFTGINIYDPERISQLESTAFTEIFSSISAEVKSTGCKRAILVGHNAHFDLAFVNAAAERCKIKKNPLHPFSCFDTATLGGLAYGQTVLAKACSAAGIHFETENAHNALYDATKTAELFCSVVNLWNGFAELNL